MDRFYTPGAVVNSSANTPPMALISKDGGRRTGPQSAAYPPSARPAPNGRADAPPGPARRPQHPARGQPATRR